jgi:hypothetical protein
LNLPVTDLTTGVSVTCGTFTNCDNNGQRAENHRFKL